MPSRPPLSNTVSFLAPTCHSQTCLWRSLCHIWQIPFVKYCSAIWFHSWNLRNDLRLEYRFEFLDIFESIWICAAHMLSSKWLKIFWIMQQSGIFMKQKLHLHAFTFYTQKLHLSLNFAFGSKQLRSYFEHFELSPCRSQHFLLLPPASLMRVGSLGIQTESPSVWNWVQSMKDKTTDQ